MIREEIMATGIGHGLAVPHARLRGLERRWSQWVCRRRGSTFDAPDGRPRSADLPAVDPGARRCVHLELLADIATFQGRRSVVGSPGGLFYRVSGAGQERMRFSSLKGAFPPWRRQPAGLLVRVTSYASAQALAFLARTKNPHFRNRKPQ